MSARNLFWFFWTVSFLPAASAVATGIYVELRFRLAGEPIDLASVRFLALPVAVAIGAAIPRLWVRFVCMVALLPWIVIFMWSIGLFYIPTLGLALFAFLVQMESDGRWHRAYRTSERPQSS